MDWIDPPNEEEAQDLARLRALRKQVAEASARADRIDAKDIQRQLVRLLARNFSLWNQHCWNSPLLAVIFFSPALWFDYRAEMLN